MSGYRAVKCPRQMGRDEVIRILRRGGILLQCATGWLVFRTPDSRRMRIGIVTRELAAGLEAEGLARRIEGTPPRLGAPGF